METNKVILLILAIFILYLAVTMRLDDVWDALTGKTQQQKAETTSATAKPPGQVVFL